MKLVQLIAVCLGSLSVSGCFFYGVGISVVPPDTAPPITLDDRERVERIVIEVGRKEGFRETDVAERISATPSSSPYVWFVSLGGPDGAADQRSVSISGQMRKDRREIRVFVRDYERAEPLPATQRLIDDLRQALERAFPGWRVDVTMRKKHRLFGP